MKCSAIQSEYVKRGHVGSIITTNVQKWRPFAWKQLRNIISICPSPHQQLSAAFQTRSH